MTATADLRSDPIVVAPRGAGPGEQAGRAELLDLDYSAYDHFTNAVYVVAPDYTMQHFNKAGIERIRFMTDNPTLTIEQARGLDMERLYLNPEHGRGLLRDASRLPFTDSYEFRGAWRKLELDPIFAPDGGHYLGAVLSVHDITEQKAAELRAVRTAKNAEALSALLGALADAKSEDDMVGVVIANVLQSFDVDYAVGHKVLGDEARFFGESADIGRPSAEAAAAVFRRGDARGLIGRAWARDSVVEAADLTEFSDDPHLTAALAAGYVAGFALPLGPHSGTAGVLEFLAKEPIDLPGIRGILKDMIQATRDAFTRIHAEEVQAVEAAENARRVEVLLEATRRAREGDLTVEIAVTGEDNIGLMADALQELISSLRVSLSQIGETATGLQSASGQLNTLATDLGDGAATSAARAESASSAATQTSAAIQTVATAAEEMSSSIREIAQNASTAATVAGEAVIAATGASDTVAALGDASTQISQVIKLITSIAQQTNLLALNATIEAARAGEHGKGFAVVANEVKELAGQTARATEEISTQISTIQGRTGEAVGAIGRIAEVISRISDIQTTIASAVEEQTATTNEIARSVTEAARGADGIAGDVSEVATAAAAASTSASHSLQSATDLDGTARELRALVDRFTL